jgi:5,6,7,8-tetrahydromethanopterin hydro-lyase
VTITMQLGECFVGSGPNAAHVNTVLGARAGPVGSAWAAALATPTRGHAPFVAVVRPGLPAKPFTLLVNKAEVRDGDHARLTWGPAQGGVAGGVVDAVVAGVVPADAVDELVLIVAVWVDPAADDGNEVYRNNREATSGALRAGAANEPALADVAAAGAAPWNPFFTDLRP